MPESVKPSVIVVDDETDIRQISALALKFDGWDVREAVNGREALRLMRQRMPDLLISDVMMPEMSGLELCHRLIEDLKRSDIPVLLTSAINEQAKLIKDFWQLPLAHKSFLHKPFSTEDLLRAIRQIVPAAVLAKPLPRQGMSDNVRLKPATPAVSYEDRIAQPAGPPTPPPWLRPKDPAPQAAAQQPAPAVTPSVPTARPTPPPAEGEHRTGYRILIIDDSEDIRMILEAALGLYHETATAENGMEGLKALDRFAPDFIISDINMPVMNGIQTAEAIRRHPTLHMVPIFFLTAETDENLPRKAFDVGGNLYLKKPLDPMRLLKYIDYFLSETKLEPGYHGVKPQTGSVAPAPAGGEAAQDGPLRILTIDFNPENERTLKLLLGEEGGEPLVKGGPFELLWTPDAQTAIGNLVRWEPDLILYNPRNPRLDGVAFGQTLKLQPSKIKQKLAFVGTVFYDVDIEYSKRNFQRGVIGLDGDEQFIAQRLGEVVAEARNAIKPKRFSFAQIQAEEKERLDKIKAADSKKALEREHFRKSYSNIQSFIDQKFSG